MNARPPRLIDMTNVQHTVAVDTIVRAQGEVGLTSETVPCLGVAVLGHPLQHQASFAIGVKRGLDVVVSSVALLICSPILLAALIASVPDHGWRVLFLQERIGRRGRKFICLKIRTMRPGCTRVIDDDSPISDIALAVKSEGTSRTTRLGRFLRRTSIDELPQLINVFGGSMSLVGPRPLRSFEVEALLPEQQIRMDMRPGLTGSWQVGGRSLVNWDARMALDVDYVATWSLRSDLNILLATPPAVISGCGAE
ncbi:MAG: sugar transferase [Thermoleophilia bacterium]